jgi:hypothetical protein
MRGFNLISFIYSGSVEIFKGLKLELLHEIVGIIEALDD